MKMLAGFVRYWSTCGLMKSQMTTLNCSITEFWMKDELPPEQRATFDDTLYLCLTNALVDDLNHDRLGTSNKPVLIVPALHTGIGASKESEDNADSLQPRLLLMEGAKVMLT